MNRASYFALSYGLLVGFGMLVADSAYSVTSFAPLLQLSHHSTTPVSKPLVIAQVSSSSSSSSFVNSTGAGASSSAISISPAGTFSSNQTGFTPGATSSSAAATATASTSGSNFANTTVTVPITGSSPTPPAIGSNAVTSTIPSVPLAPSAPTVPTVSNVSPAIATGTTVATGLTNSFTDLAAPAFLAPVTSFVPTFSQPLQPPKTTSVPPDRVLGIPSRVFPGLGLYYAPE